MAERYAVTICPGCRVGAVYALSGLPGSAVLQCPACGPVLYVGTRPASEPATVSPERRRRRRPGRPRARTLAEYLAELPPAEQAAIARESRRLIAEEAAR